MRTKTCPGLIDQKGFGLIEVLVAMGIMAVISLGVMTMLTDMAKQVQNARKKAALVELKTSIAAAINSPTAWTNTNQWAANAVVGRMACLANGTTCLEDVNGGPICTGNPCPDYPFVLRVGDAATGVTVVDGQTANEGFDFLGRRCNTYPSPTCVFRYETRWYGVCRGTTRCTNPSIVVNARMTYTAPAGVDFVASPAQYGITDLRRGVGHQNEPILVRQRFDFSGVGAGPVTPAVYVATVGPECEPGTWRYRRGFTVVRDPADIATVDPANDHIITLLPGVYNCFLTAPAFNTKGVKLQLFNLTANLQIGTIDSFINVDTQATMVLSAKFEITVPSDIVVKQVCEQTSPSGFSWGVPTKNPTTNTYGITNLGALDCNRIN